MTLLEKLKQLPESAVLGFKWQERGTNNWQAEADGYTVAELNSIIEDAEKWRQLNTHSVNCRGRDAAYFHSVFSQSPDDVVMPDHNC